MTILRDIDDDSDLRQLFGRFPTGVTALCAMNGDQPIGMTASAFVAISLKPALVSVCIKHGSWTWQQLRGCDRIGISFLGHGHAAVARQLSQRSDDRFEGLDYDVTTNGGLFLAGATAWLECALEREIPAGDHDIVLFRLHRASVANAVMPLVFHSSDFHTLAPVDQMHCSLPSSGLKVGAAASAACADR
ncbi:MULTISPECIES: flavin reductase family protein [unclassified Sphingomonas]|jgi:flavin reductase (DIM6/NTAB) family NADH-FMN oxidoreductase RutF|uniref:flavin reductase family protein n=1 Tax=unclassified Sphingomonas TaxID=196159 RepID=UPI001804D3AD|nr:MULTISPECIES: flavin reductase family protein [unclassified Sphingomonas]MBA4762147.1 flavin reductase family protein [Sphingomonas sp.]MCR5870721.1 flavin reductase family protein [Sphingomonas sp. J344]MDK2769314.1 flavin reductase family protein [Sphingomonas sp.]UUY00945.1 flavin reductase family protein [Sphingomonas sp. J315]